MKPCCKQERGCKRRGNWNWWGRRFHLRAIVGVGLILLGILVLFACAPEWLAGLVIACLFIMAGAALLGGRY